MLLFYFFLTGAGCFLRYENGVLSSSLLMVNCSGCFLMVEELLVEAATDTETLATLGLFGGLFEINGVIGICSHSCIFSSEGH